MRLIDADRTKQLLRDRLKGEYNVVSALVEGAIVNLLDEQPTAYDVDKVVEELQDRVDMKTGAIWSSPLCQDVTHLEYEIGALREAINIVKREGADD